MSYQYVYFIQPNAKYFGRQCHFLTNFEILNCKSILTFTLFIWQLIVTLARRCQAHYATN
jgi:hypothetical protein